MKLILKDKKLLVLIMIVRQFTTRFIQKTAVYYHRNGTNGN